MAWGTMMIFGENTVWEKIATGKKIIALSIPIILLLIVQFRLWFDDTGLVASWALEQQMAELHRNIGEQQNHNDVLGGEVAHLHRSHDIIEEKAREDLGFIKTDESFYLMLDAGPSR